MPRVDVVVESPIHRSFRVDQLAGMFDVPIEKKTRVEISGEVPGLDEEWQIGAIVGPSGSGKSTLARKVYGANLCQGFTWPVDKAVVDGFGDSLSIKEIAGALSAVGFSSPPSWLRPYPVLSNGEKFRADLARALLLADSPVVAYDEFTSVVDRTVAKIGSAAVAKAVRRGTGARRFVAVTCHYDVLEWLEADWVLDMASGQLARGRLRRPEIRLEIAKVHHSAWELFRRHHYLSANIDHAARCFAAFWGETPVAFSAWLTRGAQGAVGSNGADRREHRTVVLPDFQGVGIGNRVSEWCASLWRGTGVLAMSTTSHPGMIHHRSRSPLWRRVRLGQSSTRVRPNQRAAGMRFNPHFNRLTAGFRYVGPAMPREAAEAILAAEPAVFFARPVVRRAKELVAAFPGLTAGSAARLLGCSSSAARAALGELAADGEIIQAGTGGGGGRQFAFYPADGAGLP